jgi:acetyl esterase
LQEFTTLCKVEQVARLLDTSRLGTAAITDDTRAHNDAIAAALKAAGVKFPQPSAEEARALMDTLACTFSPTGAVYHSAAARTLTIPVPQGRLALRVFESPAPTGVYFHVHGGGFVIGSADGQDAALEQVVATTGMSVVSVEYRLAPEATFPAPLDDCEAAARWLLSEGPVEFGTDRFVIGAESAGAALAMGTLLRLDGDRPGRGFRAATMLSGVYDLSMTPSQRAYGGGEWDIVNTDSLRWFYEQYVPDPAQRTDPFASPLYADVAGLPPTLLTIGTADPLIDDNLFFFARMVNAGVDAQIEIAPGGIHGFHLAPLPIATRAMARITAFLNAAIAG